MNIIINTPDNIFKDFVNAHSANVSNYDHPKKFVKPFNKILRYNKIPIGRTSDKFVLDVFKRIFSDRQMREIIPILMHLKAIGYLEIGIIDPRRLNLEKINSATQNLMVIDPNINKWYILFIYTRQDGLFEIPNFDFFKKDLLLFLLRVLFIKHTNQFINIFYKPIKMFYNSFLSSLGKQDYYKNSICINFLRSLVNDTMDKYVRGQVSYNRTIDVIEKSSYVFDNNYKQLKDVFSNIDNKELLNANEYNIFLQKFKASASTLDLTIEPYEYLQTINDIPYLVMKVLMRKLNMDIIKKFYEVVRNG